MLPSREGSKWTNRAAITRIVLRSVASWTAGKAEYKIVDTFGGKFGLSIAQSVCNPITSFGWYGRAKWPK
jgi:hypothetical protein